MKLTIEFTPDQMSELARLVAKEMGSTAKPLSVAQFAKEVGEDPSTIHRKLKAGLIVKIDRPGDTRISRAELDRYCAGKPLPE